MNMLKLKTSILMLSVFLVTTGAMAQSSSLCPDNKHPHMIDLGLPSGTKWACCNVGADKPEAYGCYYAWGETEEKEVYNWTTYKHCDGTEETCHNIGSNISGTQYDVVHMKWGGRWQMPTLEQIKELDDNCTCLWTIYNGVKGGKFTSKKNGKSIFLPAAGERWNGKLSSAGFCSIYWSSMQDMSRLNRAYYISFDYGYELWGNNYNNGSRDYGHTVRPVSK